MSAHLRLASLLAIVVMLAGADLLACGDKFLVGSRGTRYQRPKNARIASIVIYADPSSETRGAPARVQSMLKSQGHSTTTATTLEQLSAILKAGTFDVVVVASDAALKVRQVLSDPGAAAVVAFDTTAKRATLLSAIDTAVQQRDLSLRKK